MYNIIFTIFVQYYLNNIWTILFVQYLYNIICRISYVQYLYNIICTIFVQYLYNVFKTRLITKRCCTICTQFCTIFVNYFHNLNYICKIFQQNLYIIFKTIYNNYINNLRIEYGKYFYAIFTIFPKNIHKFYSQKFAHSKVSELIMKHSRPLIHNYVPVFLAA